MKRSTLLIILALVPIFVSALNLTFDNIELSFQTEPNGRNTSYSSPIFIEDAVIPYHPGAPAIPVKTVYFELSNGEEIGDVSLTPNSSRSEYLDFLPTPIPAASPLSLPERASMAEPNSEYYTMGVYPENQLYEFDTVQIGSHTVGRISFYTYQWNSADNSVMIPESFDAEIITEQNRDFNPKTDNYASNAMMKSLGFDVRNDIPKPGLLIITGNESEYDYSKLVTFYKNQGISVTTMPIILIEALFTGEDLQEKIRYCIMNAQILLNVSFVTLAGDVDIIPARELYAFDCAYGAYDDENNIPGDMYYSCLDGNWDANNNGIYGEDEDEVDYYPDVFVSRLPLQPEEIDPYIDMLIEYESGNIPNYNKAAGFSMELWTGSNSVVCQEYIYDKFFPGYYDISLISGDENTTENAYNLLNDNQNIIQHTGHAGKTVLSLENGYVRNSNLEMLDNDWGGVLYSIGCWSAALDYDSIGENLVTSAGEGLLGYVGNSRYGWGAPAAPGFGFSEFYQKQFMKNLFENETVYLAEANALQKIPFIPFFQGTSVFKWVAYELNAVGDSYFRINTSNPENLELSINEDLENIIITATTNGAPVEDVVITMNEVNYYTDSVGRAYISKSNTSGLFTGYKPGYKYVEESLVISPYRWDFSFDEYYEQGEHYEVEFEFVSDEEFESFTAEFTSSENIEIISSPQEITMSDRDFKLKFKIKNFAEVGLLENNLMQSATINTPDEFPDQSLPLKISAADFTILNHKLDYESYLDNGSAELEFTLNNLGTSGYSVNKIIFNLPESNGAISSTEVDFDIYVDAGEYLNVYNYLYPPENYNEDSVTIEISIIAENDHNDFIITKEVTFALAGSTIYEDFEEEFGWTGNENWQEVETYAYDSDRSLSCRPETVGQYLLQSPEFAFQRDLILDFQYRYKMPMYGKDGVYFVLETETTADTLIFLGAGGALDVERNPEVYIEGNWDLYTLDVAEAITSEIAVGESCRLNLVFNYDEEIEGFNQYSAMEDIGVFIDDLRLYRDMFKFIDEQNAENTGKSVKLYPNPFSDFGLRIELELPKPEKIKIDIFNVKGQKVRSLKKDGEKGENLLIWNGRDRHNKQCSSGVYLLKIDSKSKTYFRKVVYIK